MIVKIDDDDNVNDATTTLNLGLSALLGVVLVSVIDDANRRRKSPTND